MTQDPRRLRMPPCKVRNRHIYIAGSSQHGKSTMIERMFTIDMWNGCGLTLLDPKRQGNLAENILTRVPPHREADAIYLDVANPIPIDLMSWETKQERDTLSGELSEIFLSFSPEGATDQWPNILQAVINTLLAARNCSFIDINTILVDDDFRDKVLARVQENNQDGSYDAILEYWMKEFPKRRKGAEDPILSRMKKFIFSPAVKLLDTPNAPLRIADVIRKRRIFIVNLGTLSKPVAHLVGKLIVAKIQQAVFQQKPDDLVPHFLYADEFQNFQTSSFDLILSEAGGFRLCLTLANQGFYQLEQRILQSIFTNVTAGKIAFNISHEDIHNWAHLCGEHIDPDCLADLPPFTAFYKLYGEPPIIKPTEPPLDKPTPEQYKTATGIKKATLDDYRAPAQTSTKRSNPPPPSNSAP